MTSTNSALIVPPPSTATALVTNDIRDIRQPVPIPNYWIWLWLGIAVWVIITAAVLGWVWWRKKKSQIPPIPVVPPHVRARNKLAGALALLQDPRLFCILVSDTLRVYLEERFDFHAPERTTEEFLLELKGTTILNVDQKQRLAEFLEQCDLVKFARFEPTEIQLRELLEAALRLIDETSYVQQLPAAAPRPGLPPAAPPPLPMTAQPAVTAARNPESALRNPE